MWPACFDPAAGTAGTGTSGDLHPLVLTCRAHRSPNMRVLTLFTVVACALASAVVAVTPASAIQARSPAPAPLSWSDVARARRLRRRASRLLRRAETSQALRLSGVVAVSDGTTLLGYLSTTFNNDGTTNYVATPTDPQALTVSVPITPETPFALLITSAGIDYPAVGVTTVGASFGASNDDIRGTK